MLRQKFVPIQECESSTLKNEYEYLYKKDGELKGDKIRGEDEGIVEYGIDFITCKVILDKIEFLEKILKKKRN